MKYLIFTIIVFISSFSSAQSTFGLTITFLPTYENSLVSLNETYFSTFQNDSLQVETIKFFISQVELYQENDRVFVEENSYHLVDAANEGSLSFELEIPDGVSFSQLKFNIGIDSLTNVSGAFGGDLDPTNGMYWTWQSGYINFKLEGVSDLCPARNNRFQFHLGGYQSPFNTLQNVELKILDTKKISIDVAIDQLLAQINLKETYQVMSPNQQAVELSELVTTIFSISK